MRQKVLDILNNDIKDLQTVDFSFNYLFLKRYYELEDRINNVDEEAIEELNYDLNLFEKINDRNESRSAYYANKLSLYTMDLYDFVRYIK